MPFDPCNSALCAFHCRGNGCGWDSAALDGNGLCVTGGVTTTEELYLGACGSLTSAPTTAVTNTTTAPDTSLSDASDGSTTKYAGFSLPVVVGAGFVVLAVIVAVVGIAVTRKRGQRDHRRSSRGFADGAMGFNEVELMTTRTEMSQGESAPPLPKLNFGPSTPYHGVYSRDAGVWDSGAEHAIAESTL